MNVEVKEMPAFHVASVRHVGPYHEIGSAFDTLYQWAGPSGVLGPNTITLGVYWDDPDQTPENELRSDACVTVAEGTAVGEGLTTQIIKGGKYAVYHTEIHNNEFKEAWERFHSEWFPTSGLKMREAVCYEIYHNNAMEDPERKWIVDICIAVE